jgi:hypothetical protein
MKHLTDALIASVSFDERDVRGIFLEKGICLDHREMDAMLIPRTFAVCLMLPK